MSSYPELFAAWRTVQLGSREVVDALVKPAHQGPSTDLQRFLGQWSGAHYWSGGRRERLILVRPTGPAEPAGWAFHTTLFLLTLLCSLAAGAAMAGTWFPIRGPAGPASVVQELFQFFQGSLAGDWRAFLTGWAFAVPSLAILLIHELGHYLAARRYVIDTSLPYFIPMPPIPVVGSPIGSFGAFIRVRSPVIDRQQLLDVGAAGPLAGFVVAIVVLAWGYTTSERVPFEPGEARSYVVFAGNVFFLGDSLLTRWLSEWLAPGSGALRLSLPAFAGWVGCFLTGLNLLPLSQLDGGHIAHGLLGKRQSLLALGAVAGLVYLSQHSWSWLLWVALALLVGGGRLGHPPVAMPDRPVPTSRVWVGLVCLGLLALTFVPVPFAG